MIFDRETQISTGKQQRTRRRKLYDSNLAVGGERLGGSAYFVNFKGRILYF